MTIRYTATQKDVSALLSYCWKHSRRMRRLGYLYTAGLILLLLGIQFLGGGKPTVKDVLAPIVIGLISVPVARFLIPLRTKKNERILTVDPEKISTQIGKLKGDIPWAKVENIFTTDEYIFILRRNLNGLVLPRRAFLDETERHRFILLSREYLDRSKAVVS